MGQTSVDTGELRTHSKVLHDIASSSEQVAGEAESIGIGDWKMYGLFCSPIACSILGIADASHTATFKALQGINMAIGASMDATCRAYEDVEQANIDIGTTIGTTLASGPQA